MPFKVAGHRSCVCRRPVIHGRSDVHRSPPHGGGGRQTRMLNAGRTRGTARASDECRRSVRQPLQRPPAFQHESAFVGHRTLDNCSPRCAPAAAWLKLKPPRHSFHPCMRDKRWKRTSRHAASACTLGYPAIPTQLYRVLFRLSNRPGPSAVRRARNRGDVSGRLVSAFVDFEPGTSGWRCVCSATSCADRRRHPRRAHLRRAYPLDLRRRLGLPS